MSKRVLIIHGFESNSREHWFLEEKTRLEKLGYEVSVPDMPNTFHPKKEEWLKVVEDFKPDENSILIGHSLGGTIILSYLGKAEKTAGKCVFIATPIRKLGYKETEIFFEPDFNYRRIRNSAKSFLVLNQTKDPYVEPQHGRDLAEYLGVNLILIEGNDHFDKIDFSLIERNI